MKNLIEELEWRGLIQDIIPETEDLLMKEKVSGYIGFDPTSDSLHIGSLVPIILLMHLQRAGHKPYALIGGATGMVGDPSGKSAERNMLSMEQINLNVQGVKKQLSKFLDFNSNTENAAVLVNNIDWFNDFTFLDFIRDVGKYITVNYMMSKDSVKKRLETGMSFTEFTYQLVQGYDFYHLYKTYGIKLQMGGSDQWGNIVTGTELIRKKIQGEAFAFTAPLIKKADGGKFGKTESGNVWLDASKTSPYSFYQFWLNTTDDDAEKYIKIFTFLPKEEIDEIIAIHNEALHLRTLQKRLAQELTCMVHSEKDFEFAIEASKILFGDDTSEALKSLNENELVDIMDGVPRFEVAKLEFENGISIIDLLVNTSILPSKSEAKKMIQSNAISLNKIKNGDVNASINSTFLLNDKYLLVQKGKKNYYLIQAF